MSERPQRARIIAAAISAGIVLAVLSSTGGSRSPGRGPRDLIFEELVPAMRQGNVRRYLNCFAPELRAELQRAAETDGREKFRAALLAQNARVTGVSVSDEEMTGDRATLRLEWCYQTDSDVQTAVLVRHGGRWRIASLTAVQRSSMPIPYGTKVVPGL